MTLKATETPVLPRVYPHVDDIEDWRAQQTIRLLWDRIASLEARLQATEATQGDLVNAVNRQDDAVTLADKKADEALALTQRVPGEPLRPGSGSGGGGGGGTGALVWAWVDRGGNPPVVPDPIPPDAPVTLDDWRGYFFGLIDRTIGADAADYEAVLLELRDLGMHVNAVPFEVPQESWGFFSMSLIIDGTGHPRGRIQLPTAVADALGYYTHEMQIIADA